MTAEDYLQQLRALMPRGIAWVDDDPVLQMAAQECARLHHRIDRMVIESIPAYASEMLPEWERDWGLPSPCMNNSARDRVAVLSAKVRGELFPSGGYLLSFLNDLGYPNAQIERPEALRAGFLAGDRVNSLDWHYAVVIKTGTKTIKVEPMRAGDRAGARLYEWDDDNLQCYLKRIFQSHLKVLVAYSN